MDKKEFKSFSSFRNDKLKEFTISDNRFITKNGTFSSHGSPIVINRDQFKLRKASLQPELLPV